MKYGFMARVLFPAIIVAGVIFGGCQDEDPVTPPPTPTGTIIVDMTPDHLPLLWTLSNTDQYYPRTGFSDAVLEDMPIGEYSLGWAPRSGWTHPAGSVQTLQAESTIVFEGTFVEIDPPKYVQIPPAAIAFPATFTMGSDGGSDEGPHQVTLTRRFMMSEIEVTLGQYAETAQWAYDNGYARVVGGILLDALDGSQAALIPVDGIRRHIGFHSGVFHTNYPDLPVGDVTWYGAAAYCDWLSLREGLPRAYDHGTWTCNGGQPYAAAGYRLPTEAEWEFACRAGTATTFNTGECLHAGSEANFQGHLPLAGCPTGPVAGKAVAVKTYPENGWGLFETHGNNAEWCQDYYGMYGGDSTDPVGPPSGLERVYRGGSWAGAATHCRSAKRSLANPLYRYNYLGFRPVRSIQ